MKNNLFYFATSELSQDAFICWLLSFALEQHRDEDPELAKCADDLVKLFIGKSAEVKEIKRQYKNIDVLVLIENDEYIIIEDKTFSGQHSDQINRYADKLVKEDNVPKEKIYSVYWKIIEQPYLEKGVRNVTRADLIEIFKQYSAKVRNHIFVDYYNHLLKIDKEVKRYNEVNIKDWRKQYDYAYVGFFTYLQNEEIIDNSRDGFGWKYENNLSGGFWCLYWFSLRENELDKSGLGKVGVSELYLQFEDNIIAVKLICNDNTTNTTEIRWNIFDYFKQQLNVTDEIVKKKAFRPGKYMTVCYVEYDMSDHKEKIEMMQSVMRNIAQGAYVYQ